MIFQNIDFHNVEELEEVEPGKWKIWRIPASLRSQVNEQISSNTASFCSGVELRFKILGDGVDLYLSGKVQAEAHTLAIYYGSFQGGWEYSTKAIGCDVTKIHIAPAKNLDKLKTLTKEHNLQFNPEVVRVVLPYTHVYFHGIEGDVVPPSKEDMPDKTYLAYGSSITHGSLSLIETYSYPFRISQKMGMDYLNYGFAGSAFLEKEMAEYIVGRKDWSAASVEMGINMLGKFTAEEFEERVDTFTHIFAEDKRPVFATSIFRTLGDNDEKQARQFREIVKVYASDRLIFTDGLDILSNPLHISADLTHPTLEGVQDIVENWSKVMLENM